MSIGWIKLHREIQEHWIFTDPIKFKWWVQILMKVNHKEGEILLGNSVLKIKKGQSACSLRTWSLTLNCSVKSVSAFFELLKSHNMIESKIIGKGKQSTTLITVSNYTTYQSDNETLDNTQSNTQSNTQGKHKGNTKGVQSKNVENENNEKENKVNDIEERKLKFAETLKPFLSVYGKDMIFDFYCYWTEPNKSNTKFKQELQKTWDTKRRLQNWCDNDSKFGNKSKGKEPRHEYTYNFDAGGTEKNKFTESEHLAYLAKYKNAKLVYKSKSEVESD